LYIKNQEVLGRNWTETVSKRNYIKTVWSSGSRCEKRDSLSLYHSQNRRQ